MLRLLVSAVVSGVCAAAWAADRPNILWLTSEDNGPHYGCYGDAYATTPNIDALAAKGLRFNRCWSNAPVCAPARTCLISGRWAPSDGAEHMRSEVPMPKGHKMYPQLLREAGYYCTNNSKEDYNLSKPSAGGVAAGKKKAKGQGGGADAVWHDSSGKAHWKNRAEGQPFFAIFNNTITHESQIRRRPHTLTHDPAKAPLPPFHPDTPEVRHDWAQYYDNLTLMDAKLGEYLAELEAAGLAEDTIIMHYGDHGPGMPRFKRWPYNSGLHVGLIMYFPPKWKHLAPKGYAAGAASEELVSFIDLPATLLSIAGVQPPDYFHGRAICGQFGKEAPEQAYIHGFRGRMDERYDLVRSTTDGRYVYVRQYMPHLPYGQYLNYMFQQATTRVWKDFFDQGKVNELQARFWKEKPAEELYDLKDDPWETKNLAQSQAHADVKKRLREAQQQWLVKTRDLGFIPEAERLAVAGKGSPKDAFATEKTYPIATVLEAVNHAIDRTSDEGGLREKNAIVRYWAAMGRLIRAKDLSEEDLKELERLLEDPSPSVRIVAAECLLVASGDRALIERAGGVLLASADPNQRPYMETLEALNALDRHPEKIRGIRSEVEALPKAAPPTVPGRLKEYIARLHEHLKGQ
jgi:arylsulfatase A-like enzyme